MKGLWVVVIGGVLMAILAGLGLRTMAGRPVGAAVAVARGPAAADAAAILRATVRIEIVAPYQRGDGRQVYVYENGERIVLNAINRGLGTLIASNGRGYILTHDHYAQIDAAVAEVIITDHAGRVIVLPIADFRRAIRYRNNGVMLIDAPGGLPPGVAVADGEAVGPGRQVQVVHRAAGTGTLSVVPAKVDGWLDVQGLPSFLLTNVNGEIIAPGNSGGGVWVDGRPAGVIHRTLLAPDPTAETAAEAAGVPSHRSYATRLSPGRIALLGDGVNGADAMR